MQSGSRLGGQLKFEAGSLSLSSSVAWGDFCVKRRVSVSLPADWSRHAIRPSAATGALTGAGLRGLALTSTPPTPHAPPSNWDVSLKNVAQWFEEETDVSDTSIFRVKTLP